MPTIVLSFVLLCMSSGQLTEAITENWEYGKKVLLFTAPGCAICELLEPSIIDYCSENGLELVKLDFSSPENLVKMYVLLKNRGLPVEWTGKSPSVFTQASQVIGVSTFDELNPIFRGKEPTTSAPQQFRLLGTFSAGLVDGVNPCTLNVLLVLLSICLMTSRKKVVLVGVLFIAGVVGTYFLVGLGLGKVLEPLRRVAAVMSLLYLSLGLGLLYLGLRPPVRALNKIKIELARYIRDLRGPSMGYIAVFATGVLSSAFEFVCTGQVYIPYVMYLSTQRPQVLISNLLLYNFAFSLPMLVMVIAFSRGLNSETIQRSLKTPLVQKAGLAATALLGIYFLITGAAGLFRP